MSIPLKADDLNVDSDHDIPPILKPFITAAPAVIAALNPVWAVPMAIIGAIYAEQQQSSSQKILKLLNKKLMDLELKGLVTQEYLQSESYQNLVIDILTKMIKFNTEEKRKAIAGIYGQVIAHKAVYENSDEKILLDIVEKISFPQSFILKFVGDKEEDLREVGSWENFYEIYNRCVAPEIDQYKDSGMTNLDKYIFKYHATQLELLGLVSCDGLSGFVNNGMHFLVDEDSVAPSVDMTPIGKKFLFYIRNESL